MTALSVVTANMGNKAHNVTPLAQLAMIRRLKARGIDVICIQEAHPHLTRVSGYTMARQPGPGASQLVTYVTKRRELVGSGALRAHDGTRHKWPDRWNQFVQVWDDEIDRPVSVLNLHLNSSIDAAGVPAKGNDDGRVTKALNHIDMAAQLARFFHVRYGPVIVVGDTNIDQDADERRNHADFPHAEFAQRAMSEVRLGKDTLGGRHVDRQFYTPECTPVTKSVIPMAGLGTAGVHKAVLVGYRIGTKR